MFSSTRSKPASATAAKAGRSSPPCSVVTFSLVVNDRASNAVGTPARCRGRFRDVMLRASDGRVPAFARSAPRCCHGHSHPHACHRRPVSAAGSHPRGRPAGSRTSMVRFASADAGTARVRLQYGPMSNNFSGWGSSQPPSAVAQYRVGFLPVPRTRSVLVCERIAERFVNAASGGVSASEER